MKTYHVVLMGKSPLLMHWDNIEGADALRAWRETPEHKKLSVAGDDRSPAFTWMNGLYNDGAQIVLPADNIARCLMEGGAQVPVPGGKNGKTFKSQSQSGMMPGESAWPLLVDGQPIAMRDLDALREELDFAVHQETAQALGFSLFVKRAKIGASKHVRVRPRFDRWAAHGTILVWDDQITQPVLTDILRFGGDYKGLGDWRPGGKTPGPYGRFSAEVTEVRE